MTVTTTETLRRNADNRALRNYRGYRILKMQYSVSFVFPVVTLLITYRIFVRQDH
jgi:hypothetical protein